MKFCRACRKELPPGRGTGRREECPFCSADLHCCLNCKFYDPAAPKQCREPMAELVREKAKGNFCDYFLFAERAAPGGGEGEAGKSRAALDDLFKK